MPKSSEAILSSTIKAPRYHQLYTILRGWIFGGTYGPGEQIPSEHELCRTFGVSRQTSHKAIDMLVQEGLLTRTQGKGTFVSTDLGDAPHIENMEHLVRQTVQLSKRSKVTKVSIREVTATDEICEDLKIPRKSKVREISFVRTLEDGPIGFRRSYVILDPRLDITQRDLMSKPMLKVFESKGVNVVGAEQLIGACLADSTLASLLETHVGAPLVRVRLITFDDSGRPIERSTGYNIAEKYEHHIYLARQSGSKTRRGPL
jgi:GntR family transcriptional regulator